jgi:hypothetical protein
LCRRFISCVRVQWDDEQEKWYFSVNDVIGLLTNSINPQAYWRKLKERLKKEGNEAMMNCHGLRNMTADGKVCETNCPKTSTTIGNKQEMPEVYAS